MAPQKTARAALATVSALLALGLTASVWAAELAVLAGTPAAIATLVGLAGAGTALGASARLPASRAGLALAGLGGFTLAAPSIVAFLPQAMVWAGGGTGSPAIGVGLARLLIAALLLLPLGAIAGAVLRAVIAVLPDGAAGPRTVAAGAAGVLVAVGFTEVATLRLPGLAAGPDLAGATAVVVGIVLFLLLRGVRTDDPALSPASGRGAGLTGAAAGFTVAAWWFLALRTAGPAIGPDLPALPVDRALVAAGLVVGGLLGVALAWLPRGPRGPWLTGLVVLATAAVAMERLYAPFTRWSARFQGNVRSAGGSSELVDQVGPLFAPHLVPVGILLGLTAVIAAARLPAMRDARSAWTIRALWGAAAGAAVGAAFPPALVVAEGVPEVILAAAMATAVLGGALLVPGQRTVLRLGTAGLAAALLFLGGARLPEVKRDQLLIERQLRAESSLIRGVQKSWKILDMDDIHRTYAVLKRGHERRLYVDGRFEVGVANTIKSHGLLAHLPLLIQTEPRRVGVIGPGNGIGLRAVLSHPVETVDVFVSGPASVAAAVKFEYGGGHPFEDDRVHVHQGTPADLLARAHPYEVILDHSAFRWSEATAATASREFLELVRDRLAGDGVYARWVPSLSLTKEGFQILLATVSDVFPQVELWSGQGGDVIVLARRQAGPHDFPRILERYRNPVLAEDLKRSWIEDPVTLMSQFLIANEGVRRISSRFPVHTRGSRHLTVDELDRRLATETVNPVPGLAAIRTNVLEAFRDLPERGFDIAVARAVQARDIERQGLDLEIESKGERTRMLQAIEIYESGLSLNPRDGALRRAIASARSAVGIDFSHNQAFTASYANFLHSVEADTTYAEGFANMGNLLLTNDDFDYALVVTRKALELAPEDDMLHHQMARIWKRRRYYNKAVPHYRMAMEINPANVEAAMGYSDIILSMETIPDIQGQLEFLRGYLEIEPSNETLHYRIDKLERTIRQGLVAAMAEAEIEEETPILMREIVDEEEGEAGPPAHDPNDGGDHTGHNH